MRRSLCGLAALLLGMSVLGFGTAQAASITYNYNFTFSGDSPEGPPPWLRATFDDGGTPGSVELTLSSAGLVENEFVRQWYFNMEPFGEADVTHVSGVEPLFADFDEDNHKADGDGFFDLLIQYAANAQDRFAAGMESVLLIELAGITADTFRAVSVDGPKDKNGFFAAAKVQGIDRGEKCFDFYGKEICKKRKEGSGWVAAPIPIVGALPLVVTALGMLGLAGWRRRLWGA